MEKMVGVRCKSCGKISYPKRASCLRCGSQELEDLELGGECKLITYTALYATPVGVDQLPLILGIVEFESGTRVLGQIMVEKAEIGMRLRPVWGALRTVRGKKVFGFKFEPA